MICVRLAMHSHTTITRDTMYLPRACVCVCGWVGGRACIIRLYWTVSIFRLLYPQCWSDGRNNLRIVCAVKQKSVFRCNGEAISINHILYTIYYVVISYDRCPPIYIYTINAINNCHYCGGLYNNAIFSYNMSTRSVLSSSLIITSSHYTLFIHT